MKDTFTIGTLAGTLGSLFLDLVSFLARLTGIRTSTPWDVAASVFLNQQYIGTVSGYIVGLAGSLALGVAAGIATAFLLRFTGNDYYMIKSIIIAESFGFAGIGFFAPLLGVAKFLRNEPATNIFALFGLLVFGLVCGFVIMRYTSANESI